MGLEGIVSKKVAMSSPIRIEEQLVKVKCPSWREAH